jgi:hypothetical protein
MAVDGTTALASRARAGTTVSRKLVWTRGCVRNEVRMLISSCE